MQYISKRLSPKSGNRCGGQQTTATVRPENSAFGGAEEQPDVGRIHLEDGNEGRRITAKSLCPRDRSIPLSSDDVLVSYTFKGDAAASLNNPRSYLLCLD